MSLDKLREIAHASLTRRTPRVKDEYGMPEPGAFVGEHTKFVVIEPSTVLALLDVAEQSEVVVMPDNVDGIDYCRTCGGWVDPNGGRVGCGCDLGPLRFLLDRLREVAP